jgi:hypothetical protein
MDMAALAPAVLEGGQNALKTETQTLLISCTAMTEHSD